ncbi:MAG TPA: hypothetical protein VNJ04_14330 [Gemmatimonadaceae bacterium]|nr:hypothetical protein [Gemmatimonadaceae bacterium]
MTRQRPLRQEFDAGRNLLETELGNGWMVIEHFEMQGGQRVVAHLTICPAPPQTPVRDGRHPGERPTDGVTPAGGITARLLRTVKVGKAEPVLRDYRTWVRKFFGEDALRRLGTDVLRPARKAKRQAPRHRRVSDFYYAELARDYETLVRQGVKRPTAELQRLRGIPLQRIRSHVHLARTNGFLTETRRGQAGGEMTAKARRLLTQP